MLQYHPDGADEVVQDHHAAKAMVSELNYPISESLRGGNKIQLRNRLRPSPSQFRNQPSLPPTAIKEYSDYMESDLAPSQAWGRRQETESREKKQQTERRRRGKRAASTID